MMPSSTPNPIVVSELRSSQDNYLIEDHSGPESGDSMDFPIFSSAYLPPRSNCSPRIMPHGSQEIPAFSPSSSEEGEHPDHQTNAEEQLQQERDEEEDTIYQGGPVQFPPTPLYSHDNAPPSTQEFIFALDNDCSACSMPFPLRDNHHSTVFSPYYPVYVATFTTPHTSDPARPSHKLFIHTHPHSVPYRGIYLYVSAEDQRFHAHPGSDPVSVAGYLGLEHFGRIRSGPEPIRLFRDQCQGLYVPSMGFPGWTPRNFHEADWVDQALLMGERLGMLELDGDLYDE
ncbi:hypothetical protein ACRE_020700 [Hapsidospora chrysogenum ATCC 11550]|uniref:Uncharacterized protein n=1 Tax=Hapsidospora chrysogenum (strain ATCC 11550 / CBS 779.69 / DSM 880 / IAM 14645 / JCM 23072 / IMI 49137) TaxID=857340 RepID=A0A086TCE4_HAPC1|nr:hypothetical protein ACRE_020700 [Hapsidospora chrysogenum ATCC 11550]